MKNTDRVKKLVVPLAGMGTRFLPTSSAYPKEMAYLVDKPVIQYIIEEAYNSGIEEIIFVMNKQKEVVKKYLTSAHHKEYTNRAFPKGGEPKEYVDLKNIISKMKFRFIEKEKTLGDGHSILFAKKYIEKNESFAVSMGDLLGFHKEPFIKQLIGIYSKNGLPVVSVEKVPLKDTSRFGVIAPKSSKGRVHVVKSIIEKPGPKLAPSRLALTGKYILTPDIFSYLEQMVKNHKSGEVKLADALKSFAEDKKLLACECLGKIQDTGSKVDFVKTTIFYAINNITLSKEIKKFIKSLKL